MAKATTTTRHAIALAKADWISLKKLGESLRFICMNGFYYVYMLQSISAPASHYVGFTEDLASRLNAHNAGSVPATTAERPLRIKTAVTFTDLTRARAFERYLKSGSGRAFARKHF